MNEYPFISCQMSTYARAHLLEESLFCFLNQDYPGRKELVILNDFPRQQLQFPHPSVRIINRAERFPTLGDSRNYAIERCEGQIVVPWDDDDIYLPGYLMFVAKQMQKRDWFRFNLKFYAEGKKIVKITESSPYMTAFTKDAWRKIGGIASVSCGEDHQMATKLKKETTGSRVTIAPSEIQYIYRWGHGVPHASGYGGVSTGYDRLGAWAERHANAGTIPTGEVQLKPQWHTDWIAEADKWRTSSPVDRNGNSVTSKKAGVAISIVIPTLNDNAELAATVNSIRFTAGDAPEIIVVDDQSKDPVILDGVTVIRNQTRRGVGQSRHIGVTAASGKYIFIIDSHMRFEAGWYEEALKRIEAKPKTIYCCTCLGLGEGRMEILKESLPQPASEVSLGHRVAYKGLHLIKQPDGSFKDVKNPQNVLQLAADEIVTRTQTAEYYGATLRLCEKNTKGNLQVFEGVWKSNPVDDAELPCLMGAAYLMSREVFFAIGGFNELRVWGSSEPYLSLKAWLAGYEIRLLKTVRVGHKFRDASPYSVEIWALCYNKMRAARTLLKDNESAFILCKLKDCYEPKYYDRAEQQINVDMPQIIERRAFYRKLFVHDLKWYTTKFKIHNPIT